VKKNNRVVRCPASAQEIKQDKPPPDSVSGWYGISSNGDTKVRGAFRKATPPRYNALGKENKQ
jgi:hypothetical protein